ELQLFSIFQGEALRNRNTLLSKHQDLLSRASGERNTIYRIRPWIIEHTNPFARLRTPLPRQRISGRRKHHEKVSADVRDDDDAVNICVQPQRWLQLAEPEPTARILSNSPKEGDRREDDDPAREV